MDDDSSPFRDFTLEEWARAFELGGNNREAALMHARAMVAGARQANGYSLDPELWALLSLVSRSCAERVREYLTREPEEIRRDVEQFIRRRQRTEDAS